MRTRLTEHCLGFKGDKEVEEVLKLRHHPAHIRPYEEGCREQASVIMVTTFSSCCKRNVKVMLVFIYTRSVYVNKRTVYLPDDDYYYYYYCYMDR